jgi:hypothetical protein
MKNRFVCTIRYVQAPKLPAWVSPSKAQSNGDNSINPVLDATAVLSSHVSSICSNQDAVANASQAAFAVERRSPLLPQVRPSTFEQKNTPPLEVVLLMAQATSAIGGLGGSDDVVVASNEKKCVVCFALPSASTRLKRCGRCKVIRYCGPEHQAQHWPVHRALCQGSPARSP